MRTRALPFDQNPQGVGWMNLFLALVMIGLVGGMLARVEALHKEVRALREEIERLRRH